MSEEDSKYCGCLYYSANALGRIMTKMAEEEFAITGLAPSHAFLLMGANDRPGIQPKEISKHMQLTPSTVTRLIEKLEQKGYVKRETTGRTTKVFPTDKGAKLDQTIKKAWKNLYDRYQQILGENTQKLTTIVYEASKILGE